MKDIDRRLLWKQSTSDISKRVDALLSDERERNAPKLMEIRIYTNYKPHSEEAKALLAQILKLIDLKSQKKGTAVEAAGAFLADMVRVSIAGENSHGFRPIGAGSFTGEAIGHRTFKGASEAFEKAGLVQVATARAKPLEAGCIATATSFTPTIGLRKLIADAGINGGNFTHHFRRMKHRYATGVVRLKSASKKKRGDYGEKVPGRYMKVDWSHPTVIESKAKLDTVNAYLGARAIEPAGSFGFLFRQFNDGDVKGHDYKRGGRISCEGGSFQQDEKDKRINITIDGEPVAEIDISSCHLTILHYFLGEAFDSSTDLFEGTGFPRAVIKKLVAQSLGSNGIIRRWVDDKVRKPGFTKKTEVLGKNYQKLWPIKKVKAAALKHIPILNRWGSTPHRWADFHYLDSTIILDTVHRLAADYDIPALPIHDSILVAQSKRAIAERVFSEVFEHHTGIKPRLSVRFPEETKPVSI